MSEWYGNIKANELELIHAPTNKVFRTWESAKNYAEKIKLGLAPCTCDTCLADPSFSEEV